MCLRASTTQLRYSSCGRHRPEVGEEISWAQGCSWARAACRMAGLGMLAEVVVLWVSGWEWGAYLALTRGGGHLAQVFLLRGL